MQVMRQASKRKSGLRSWSRALGVAAFALVFTASHAWAAPFTGAGQGSFVVNPVAGPDGAFSHTLALLTSFHGYTTTGGAMVCHIEQLSFEYLQEPTGACGAEELENRAT